MENNITKENKIELIKWLEHYFGVNGNLRDDYIKEFKSGGLDTEDITRLVDSYIERKNKNDFNQKENWININKYIDRILYDLHKKHIVKK